MDRERDVILREMEEVDGQIEEVVFDRLHEVAYVGTPLARTILGPEQNIKSISADDIKKYITTHYTAPRMVIAASGAVDHDELVNLSGEYFGGVPTSAPPGLTFDYEASLFSGADVRDYNDDMELGHFAMAFEGAPPHHVHQHFMLLSDAAERCCQPRRVRGKGGISTDKQGCVLGHLMLRHTCTHTLVALIDVGLCWTDPDVFSLMLCQSLLGTYDRKNLATQFTAAPLAANIAQMNYVHSMQPFCESHRAAFSFACATLPATVSTISAPNAAILMSPSPSMPSINRLETVFCLIAFLSPARPTPRAACAPHCHALVQL